MSIIDDAERPIAEALAAIGYCNPFLPERRSLEQRVLGDEFQAGSPVMHWRPSDAAGADERNRSRLHELTLQMAGTLRQRIVTGEKASDHDLKIYEDLVLYGLYFRFMPRFEDATSSGDVSGIWREFLAAFSQMLHLPERRLPSNYDPAHAFAVLFQLHRAFTSIFDWIIGQSMPIARLRAAVWQSIFSHDMRRFGRTLYRCMGDVPTLVLGPSGTGKELVARAIGQARFVPFDVRTETFATGSLDDFHPVNLSALAPTLIESELFGHRKGAFSGATADRVGWLETCGPCGTVFLDEIGELELSLQVKLLRVLQSREFQRVGESHGRKFRGKIVAATNRDLALEMQARRFREDLYFRLCADIVHTPTLHEQLADSPDDLPNLIEFLTQRILVDDPEEAAELAREVREWIAANLGDGYAWPGNIRELEQCVRNVMIRGTYRPAARRPGPAASPRAKLSEQFFAGDLTMEEVMQHYASLAFALDGSYVAAANRLRINWRTVRDKIRPELVDAYQSEKQEANGK